MMNDFIFDLDGTLTDARQYIDPEFEEFLHEFTGKHLCYICTGSDYPKVEEQLGKELTDKFDTVFACSGNHHISKGKEIYKAEPHESAYNYLQYGYNSRNGRLAKKAQVN